MTNRSESSKGKGKEVAGKKKGSKRQREEPESRLAKHLSMCRVLPTRYIDWPSIARLGLKADLEGLFTEMGIGAYMHRAEYTHEQETVQFMASLEPDVEIDGIAFRIHGKKYRLSTREIREIYGFTLHHMSPADLTDQTGMQQLWERVAADPYRMGKAKSSTIRNPTVKLMQRALGFSFFGRFEVAPVILDEWRLISATLSLVAARLEPPITGIPSIDAGVLFIENLFRTQQHASKAKPQDWPLCIGGVLTAMFRHCGVRLSEPITPIPLIDIQHLYSCRFLSPQREGGYRYPFTWAGVDMELPLPFPLRDLVTCSRPANLVFQHTPQHLGTYPLTDHIGTQTSSARPPRRSARYEQETTAIPHTPYEKEIAHQLSLLKRWNRWQDRSMTKMAAHISLLKAKLRCRGDAAGVSSSTRRRSQSPESSNPSLDLSPPPSDQESDA